MRRRPAATLLTLVAVAGVTAWVLTHGPTTLVRPGEPLPQRGTAVLASGRHPPLVIDRPLRVVGRPGAVVTGPVVVTADGVRLEDLVVEGGDAGVVVREADGVHLRRVRISGARLHGIELIDASARIEGCRIGGLRSRYGQAIEIRNTTGRPPTLVAGCRIEGGMEGIVAHSAWVEVRDNEVTATRLRGIAITEMSQGRVVGNTVRDGTGAGLYCGDFSRCDLRGNVVWGIAPDGSGTTSRDGHALVVWWGSVASLAGDALDGSVVLLLDSRLSDGPVVTAFGQPTPWGAVAAGVGVAILLVLAVRPRRVRVTAPAAPAPRTVVPA